jgi:hypothetical protein
MFSWGLPTSWLVESFFVANFWIDFLPKSLCRFIIHSTHCQELMKLWVVVGWQLATQCYSCMLKTTFAPQIPKAFKHLAHFSLFTSSSFQFSYPPRALKIRLKFPFYVPKLPFKVSLSMYLLSLASNPFLLGTQSPHSGTVNFFR